MAKIVTQNKGFNDLIRQTIIETVQEVLRDPDYGLELRGWVKKRLRKHPRKLILFEEIKRRYL